MFFILVKNGLKKGSSDSLWCTIRHGYMVILMCDLHKLLIVFDLMLIFGGFLVILISKKICQWNHNGSFENEKY